jgi:hypothetical protein
LPLLMEKKPEKPGPPEETLLLQMALLEVTLLLQMALLEVTQLRVMQPEETLQEVTQQEVTQLQVAMEMLLQVAMEMPLVVMLQVATLLVVMAPEMETKARIKAVAELISTTSQSRMLTTSGSVTRDQLPSG